MVDSVSSSNSFSPASFGSGGNDVATSSQLEKCRQQLGDWTACPSAKTPEGQKIIENLRAQITRLEQRVRVQSGVKPGNPPPEPVNGAGSFITGKSVAPLRLDVWG